MGRGNALRVRDEGERVMLRSPKWADGACRNGSAPKKQRSWLKKKKQEKKKNKTGVLSPKLLPALH